MSSVFKRASKHFQGLRSERVKVEVPEWPDESGDPTMLYFPTVLTIADLEALGSHLRIENGKVKTDSIFYSVLFARTAMDAEGVRVVPDEMFIEFKENFDAAVVFRCVVESGLMKGVLGLPQEDGEGPEENPTPRPS